MLFFGKCPSCEVLKQWVTEIKQENEELRKRIDALQGRVYDDKENEREDKKELQDVLLKFARLKDNGQPKSTPTVVQQQPVSTRPGHWPSIRATLEAEARKKADHYKVAQDKEIKEGKLSPEVKEEK